MSAVLLERSDQSDALTSALGEVASRWQGRTVLVRGEAGIGKTALLSQFCAGLGGTARVLWAVCDPLFTRQPFGPLLDLAESAGGGLAAQARAGTGPREVAAALLRELGSCGCTVLVIEDAHWADEATLDVVALLSRRVLSVPTLLVVSYRDDQLGRSHPLLATLGDLRGKDHVTRITLSGLSRAAVATLAEPLGIDPGELHGRTAGNPFFVTEVLAAGGGQIPHTVREAVLGRAARLSPPARDLLEAAAVVPRRTEAWLLDELAPDADAADLDECVGAGVLTAADGWVAFRHEIARQVTEEALLPGRRAALHNSALAALASRSDGQQHLARLVHHAEAAGDAGAVLWFALVAAERAAAAGARREAAQLYERALRFAGELEPPRQAGLLESFAGAGYFTGRSQEAATALREALRIYQDRGDLAGQGRTLLQLGKQHALDGAIIESRTALRRAVAVLGQVPPGAELARAYASLSAIYGLSDEAEAVRWGNKAIALAEETGCTDALIYALNNVGTIELQRGDRNGLAMLERSRELADMTADDIGAARAYLHLGLILVAQREWLLADGYLQLGTAHCRQRGLEAWLRWLTALTAEAALARGYWDDAAATARAILDAGPSRYSHIRCTALVVLGRVQARRGEPGCWPLLDEAKDLAKAVSSPQTVSMIAAARAEAAWLDGAPAERIGAETERALALQTTSTAWSTGELACWRWRAGLRSGQAWQAEPFAEPYRLEIAGDALSAARWWRDRQCPYDAALALASSADTEALGEALRDLRRLGARPAASIIARRLRALGERRLPRGPRPETAVNPAGLTGRQLDVLGLLAVGLRNPEIATRLVISARTVDHHVSAILHKLGTRNRGAAMAEAVRLGLVDLTTNAAAIGGELPGDHPAVGVARTPLRAQAR